MERPNIGLLGSEKEDFLFPHFGRGRHLKGGSESFAGRWCRCVTDCQCQTAARQCSARGSTEAALLLVIDAHDLGAGEPMASSLEVSSI